MASLSQTCRFLRSSQLRKYALTRGFQTSVHNAKAKNLNMPAMSPTMTEGNIASWKVKEGDKFKPGDILLEIETDKASIDIEAQDDGVMAKIFVGNGTKGIAVGSRIAVLAEEDDDLSKLEFPPEPKPQKSAPPPEAKEADKPQARPDSSQPRSDPAAQVASSSSHVPKKDPRSPPKRPHQPSPSIVGLLKLHNLMKEDILKIPTTGPRGRLLKGDVLAYVGKISKSGPAEVEAMVAKLAHLDLSNIKIRKAPAPEALKKDAEAKKDVKPIPVETDIQVEVSLENLSKFQAEVQGRMGFSPPLSTFLTEASLKANQKLPPSKLPPSPTEIFNELLGLPKKPVTAPYKPQLTALPSPPSRASAKKVDLIDFLSGAKPKAVVHKVTTASSRATINVISVTVRKEDEARGRVFLERVKCYLESEPDKLFVAWSDGVRSASSSAGADLF